jgi:hypothetical protein
MSGKFNISSAIRNGYAFALRERAYLARISPLPVGVLLITNLVTYFLVHEEKRFMSEFEQYLWSLPALALGGWFMFLEARLLLLGERAESLPEDPAYLAARRRALSLCIIIWLLFNMWWSAFWGYQKWALVSNADNSNTLITFLGLLLLGGSIWGIRFAVAHILAAVEYPIRQYVFFVNGIGISLRLIGMAFVCVIPISLCVMVVMALLLPEGQETVTRSTAILLLSLLSVLWYVSLALLTASASFALKEILSQPREEKAA